MEKEIFKFLKKSKGLKRIRGRQASANQTDDKCIFHLGTFLSAISHMAMKKGKQFFLHVMDPILVFPIFSLVDETDLKWVLITTLPVLSKNKNYIIKSEEEKGPVSITFGK